MHFSLTLSLPGRVRGQLNDRTGKITMQQIRLCGLGGQGIVVAGSILAQAGFRDKKSVALSSGYGSQVRGGITTSDLVFSDGFIDFPLVTRVDLLVSMLQEAYQDSLPLVKKEGIVVLDSSLVKATPSSAAKHYNIPATETVIRELNSEMAANIALLAAANFIGQLVSEASLEEAVKNSVSPRFVELNLRAVKVGLDLAQEVAV